VDKYFNGGVGTTTLNKSLVIAPPSPTADVTTTLPEIKKPKKHHHRQGALKQIPFPTIAPFVFISFLSVSSRNFHDHLLCLTTTSEIHYQAPDRMIEPITVQDTLLPASRYHAQHRRRPDPALQASPRCPLGRVRATDTTRGRSPSGVLTVARSSMPCEGCGAGTSIVLTYDLPPGVQKSYHRRPGRHYAGTTRVAYLPNTAAGNVLLRRLEHAWICGLTFEVGTSLTAGRQDCIVWSSVRHKTSRSGGVAKHGFPDLGYLIHCNEELDALGVPKAENI